VADDDSLATAQPSIAGTEEEAADTPPASTIVQGAKTLVPVDEDTDNLASMEDSIYSSSNSSSLSSSSSNVDHPASASTAPPEEMETVPHDKDPDPDAILVHFFQKDFFAFTLSPADFNQVKSCCQFLVGFGHHSFAPWIYAGMQSTK